MTKYENLSAVRAEAMATGKSINFLMVTTCCDRDYFVGINELSTAEERKAAIKSLGLVFKTHCGITSWTINTYDPNGTWTRSLYAGPAKVFA